MKPTRSLPSAIAIAGIFLGLSTLGLVLASDSPVTPQAASLLPRRAVVPFLAADSVLGAPATATPVSGAACGVERWAVKTLSDSASASVDYTPQDTTVSALRLLIAPTVGDNTARIQGVEFTTYRLTATLLKAKVEDDRDIHLVIADPSNAEATMIVELPDTNCSGAISSAKRVEMNAARAAFVGACGQPGTSSFKNLSGTATLSGVGFFDEIHGQTGVAPNGIELHPVLSFSGACTSGAVPSPPSSVAGSATATRTNAPGATATTSGGGYTVPGCYVAGANSCNCADFTTHSQAQWFHEAYDPADVNRLDTDHDGVVCESLPG